MRLYHLLMLSVLLLVGGMLSGCDTAGNGTNNAPPTAAEATSPNTPAADTASIPPTSAAVTSTVAETPTESVALTTAPVITTSVTAEDNTDSAAISTTEAISQADSQPLTATENSNATTAPSASVFTEELVAEPVLVPTDTPDSQGLEEAETVTETVTEVVTATVAGNANSNGAEDPEVTGLLDADPGTVLNIQFVERVTAATIDQASQFFYPASNLITASYGVDIYRLEVQSTTETGAPIDLQTDVYVPIVDATAAFPILAYAPGTTGLGDSCAPSQEIVLGRGWGSYYTHMLSYAGQGYIGVIPDGMSYDDPQRPHEYFIAELEAHTLLDAVRGAQNFLNGAVDQIGVEPLDAIFFGGYSNGGHTAFAAKDFAAEYAPELPIRGVISHGATTNVEILMRESPVFTPYLIYAYQFYYGSEVITPQQVFTQEWLPTFVQDVSTKCVDEIFVYYNNDPAAMYNDAFRSALTSGTLAEELPLFKTVLDANYAGTFGGFDIPVVFFQGTADATVTPRAQQQFARDLCAQEQPVSYVPLPTVRHVDTRQRSFIATLEWMQAIVDGETPENNCGELTGE